MTGAIVAIAVLCLPAISAGESPAAPGVLVIDDFEGYTDEEGQRIYETWIDGLGAGKEATAVCLDAEATRAGEWIEWKVPRSEFVGANPAKVKKFRIGVGDLAKPTPGGSGHIYIDDIRIVRPAPAE